jgi:hypothetical protein|nr:MAG TPA: hypothetical protein [Caudoviricetes sp.]
MLERFFKRRNSEITFLNSYIKFLKAEIRKKDETITCLEETINRDLNEYNLINILINNYGWEENTNAYNNVVYAERRPYIKFGEIKLTLEKKKNFNMDNHLKEVLEQEK